MEIEDEYIYDEEKLVKMFIISTYLTFTGVFTEAFKLLSTTFRECNLVYDHNMTLAISILPFKKHIL